ncbi:ParB N-terminal domain-containing protein [Roseomonas eburnea]|uniref:ParB N-terminal domain-containing protein n=1 Tax=Neoroseomonas eburnea TaxID=1346889 RepID=A0A9X9XJE6_9PROT|nr:ParB N-terminal domain-containing protein [Neoroseomonas eburnea]MBR0683832.1 ParB N-terminal domain-containing protein [Neoroseomonas eburnea]
MSKSAPKVALSASRDIPFNRLVLSQANVRRIKAGIAVEELAEDIARRTLLQSLTVRPVLDDDGRETGMFEVPSGGRRFRALELLVKQKRLARTAPIPCIIRTEGIAEEDSLAENVQRAPLHPLDQFRAFQALRERGRSEEDIAAAFFVSVGVVRQRLRLAAVSPRLLDLYAEDGMTLEQLMAFTVSPDHERQEQVWEVLQRSYTKEPYHIRRLLTEGAVRASDKRARFVGAEAYEAAGGLILRDLFQPDDGGWWQDAGLLDRLARERLEREAEAIRAEGWRWVEAAPDFPYGHNYGLRRLAGEVKPLSEEEAARREALQAEFDRLEQDCAEADEVPEETDRRLAEIEEAFAAFDDRPVAYDAEEVARAGVFVSIDGSGVLRVERGYVRPEDEPPVTAEPEEEQVETNQPTAGAEPEGETTAEPDTGTAIPPAEPTEEDEGIRPLPDRLLTELTAHRTLALRDAVAANPQTAFLAALHALCLRLFYRYGLDSCLEIEPKSALFSAQAPGLADTTSARAIAARHARWQAQMPQEPGELWPVLAGFDPDSREALFAHCVGLTVNAVHEAYNRRPKAIAHADRIAEAVSLDMAAVGWRPTAEAYLGRVTKGRILAAVREARGARAAERIAGLKKAEMATAAEELLAGTGWVPEPLRTPGQVFAAVEPETEAATEGEAELAADGGEPAIAPEPPSEETDAAAIPTAAIAAE